MNGEELVTSMESLPHVALSKVNLEFFGFQSERNFFINIFKDVQYQRADS